MAQRTISFDLEAGSGAPLADVSIVLAPDAATTSATSVVLPRPESTHTDASGAASLLFTPSHDIADTTYSLWIGKSRWSGLTLDDIDIRAEQLLADRPADGERTPVSSQTLTERIRAAVAAELEAEGVEALGDRLDQEIIDRRADVDAEGQTRAAADRALGARIDAIPHQGGGQAGQSAQQVAAAIEAHRADADAHHHPPDITGLASQSDLDAEAQARRNADAAQNNRLDAIEADDWVTAERIDDDAVGGRALGQHVVHGGGQGHIALHTVTADNMAPNTLGEATLDAGVVDKLNDRGTVTDEQLDAEAQARRNADAAQNNRLDAIEADDWVTGRRLGRGVVHGGGAGHIARHTITADNVAPNALGEATLDAGVVDKLNDRGTVTDKQLDVVERTAAAAGRTAAAAQLDTDTVIEIGPEFIHAEKGPKVLGVSIRHPLGAYAAATIMAVSPAGQPAVLVAYDATQIHQDTLAEVSAAALHNIWSQTERIPDGQGGTVEVPRWTVGSYIPVEIRLQQGRGGDTVLLRVVDVLVVAASDGESGPELGDRVLPVAGTAMQEAGDSARAAREDHVHGLSLAAGSGLSFNASDELDHTPQVLRVRLGSMNTSGLRNGAAQALSSSFSALVMVRTLNLPTGAAYDATTGVLTLPVGLWLITGQARIVGSADRGAGHHSLAIFADPEGIDPKQAIGRVDEDSYRDADAWMQVNAVAHIVASGSNDTWAITLEALSSEGSPTATAAWLDILKLA